VIHAMGPISRPIRSMTATPERAQHNSNVSGS
jgi:hypothetical protein